MPTLNIPYYLYLAISCLARLIDEVRQAGVAGAACPEVFVVLVWWSLAHVTHGVSDLDER